MKFHNDLSLTDDLERKLLQQALLEQNQLRPFLALKNLFLRLFGKTNKA
ncbi:hypothetical protein [Alcaligenes endophyticus]|uniref:Transposase n=1 Tax=Alcaligenes endophyticus TaxID=1929088 RepID=A0ABT8EHV0_9BURK|nr:hypothetical protein [Alcaligenes endophyticus]MCX5592216.1 hypothetical protein [Alcaligenes endophyticus]MDN4120863.1 hypothetical protein [Alcaligenes endophyticus]